MDVELHDDERIVPPGNINNNNNNNQEDDDDDDDEEEEEEEEEDDDDDHDALGGHHGDVLEGGVAEPQEDGRMKPAAEADITLYFTVTESLDFLPNHPILKPGVTVQIGLDKSTKLQAVMQRFCDFCNQAAEAGVSEPKARAALSKLEVNDLEFVHCQLLQGHDTAEAAALMKNDVIRVRRERSSERKAEQERLKLQRESDKDYFAHLREGFVVGNLYKLNGRSNSADDKPGLPQKYADVILECKGSILPENAFVGEDDDVVCFPTPRRSNRDTDDDSTGHNDANKSSNQENSDHNQIDDRDNLIKCHSVIISRRCPWLGRKIAAARQERARRRIVTVTENDPMEVDAQEHPKGKSAHVEREHQHDNSLERRIGSAESKESEEEDAVFHVPNRDRNNNNNRPPQEIAAEPNVAAQIENDEEDQQQQPRRSMEQPSGSALPARQADVASEDDDVSLQDHQQQRVLSSRMSSDDSCVWVTLDNHSLESVQLLLEYCYTNRVVPLGMEAFVESCRTKPDNKKHQGPVPPFMVGSSSSTRKWPNRGEPTISFGVAASTISLADEASLPRLSLMCEIAAAQLVTPTNVVQALSLCQRQKNLTGNDLPRLRKAAMKVIFYANATESLFIRPTFRRALEIYRETLVPTLLAGTMEAVDSVEVKKTILGDGGVLHAGEKRDWQSIAFEHFDQFDRDDALTREKERSRRRIERFAFEEPGHKMHDVDMDRARVSVHRSSDYWDDIDAYDDMESGQVQPSEAGNRVRSLKRMRHHVWGDRLTRSVLELAGATAPANIRRSGNNNNLKAHRSGSREDHP